VAPTRPALAAWGLAALAGVALGGSYWPHYLIALVPLAAAGAAATLARHPRSAVVALLVLLLPAARTALQDALRDWPDRYQGAAASAAAYVRARAEPHQSVYVLYAKANVVYYSGLRDPFPYNWSLMMRAAPRAQPRLRTLLASEPRRPTWIVEWQAPTAFGLDRSGATRALLRWHYRRVAGVCGHPILLARGARAKPPPWLGPHACGTPQGTAVVQATRAGTPAPLADTIRHGFASSTSSASVQRSVKRTGVDLLPDTTAVVSRFSM
jgi:hypothetical protein